MLSLLYIEACALRVSYYILIDDEGYIAGAELKNV